MISKYDVIRAFEMADKKGEKLAMCLSEDKNSLLETETGEYVCSMDTYLDYMRKELHCDFECIYHDHASLTTIYRCKECGAVIFSGDDERYDPNLKCPVCAGYNHGDFWTKEEIEADEKKQKEIQFYIDEILLGSTVERTKRLFAPETRVISCFERDHVLYLNLSSDILQMGDGVIEIREGRELLKKNILRNFSKIDSVEIYIDGKSAFEK